MKRFFIQLFKVAIFSSVGVTAALFTLLIGMIAFGAVLVGIADTSTVDVGSENLTREFVDGDSKSDNELLVIPINGVIMGELEPSDDWLTGIATGITYGYEVKEKLFAASEQDDIKGIFLQINSPGGTIFGSNAILDGVTEYKKRTGKPVVAFVSGMAASGGYWSALGADQIIADSGSTIGSIGVIFGPFKYYDTVISEDGGILAGGVVTENGIQSTYISAGRSKDIGNPYRKLTVDEISTMQNMVNQSYEEFVSKVSQYRGIPADTIKNQIGALIYSEQQAQSLKLIDATGSKQFAYSVLAQKAGLGNNYQITRLQQEPSFLGTMLGALAYDQTRKTQSSSCQLSSMILAYHGDVQVLCQ